jgi:hypothetical protein
MNMRLPYFFARYFLAKIQKFRKCRSLSINDGIIIQTKSDSICTNIHEHNFQI